MPTTFPSDNVDDFGGTSAAAPFVAGTITLMKEIYPNITSDQIVSVLKKASIEKLRSSKWMTDKKGLPNFNEGQNLLDVFEAVNETAKLAGKIYKLDQKDVEGLNSITKDPITNTPIFIQTISNTFPDAYILAPNNTAIRVRADEDSSIFAIAVAGDTANAEVYAKDSVSEIPIKILERQAKLLICSTKGSTLSTGIKSLLVKAANNNFTITNAIEVLPAEIKIDSLKISGSATNTKFKSGDTVEILGQNFNSPNLKMLFENERTHNFYAMNIDNTLDNNTKILFDFAPNNFIKIDSSGLITDPTKNLQNDNPLTDKFIVYLANDINNVSLTNLYTIEPYQPIQVTSLKVSGYPTTTHLEFQDGINIVGKNLTNPNLKLVFKNLTTGEFYKRDLIDGAINNTQIYFEFNPERFIKVGNTSLNLKNDTSNSNVKFKISIENSTGSLQFTEEYTIATENTWKIRMYNVDDTSYAYVNLNGNYQRTSYATDTTIDITDRMNQGDNQFDLKTYNIGGGYTWGFDIIKYGRVIHTEKAGTAGVIGANNNDQSKTQRYVFDKTLTIPSTIRNSNEIIIRDNLVSKVVFESERDGTSEIYIMNENGTNQTRLTYISNSFNYNAKWSPNKEKIIFTSYSYDHDSYYLYSINSDGSNLKKLTNDFTDSYRALWTYNGKKMVYVSDVLNSSGVLVPQIFSIDGDGNNLKNLTNDLSYEFSQPSLKAGGDKIVFRGVKNGISDIFVMNIDGSGKVQITNRASKNETSNYNYTPKWSPDETKIAYQTDQGGISSIWTMQSDGEDKKRISSESSGNPIWSPDGSKLAYGVFNNNNYLDLRIFDLKTNTVKSLSNTSTYDEIVSDWFNDARGILFASDIAGNFDIYSIESSGSNFKQLTTNPALDFDASTYNPRKTFSILSKSKKRGVDIKKNH